MQQKTWKKYHVKYYIEQFKKYYITHYFQFEFAISDVIELIIIDNDNNFIHMTSIAQRHCQKMFKNFLY